MYASYGLNSRTQLSWPPIIHRLTFLITIQGRRNVKNFDGNKPINIVSGSEANMTTLCEMEFFDFLWLIWVHYLPLPPT